MQTSLSFRTNRELFSNYYLDEHLPETEAWAEVTAEELREAKAEIQDLWQDQKETAPQRNESQLEEKFIRPMFRRLGIHFEVEESVERGQRRPDYGFFGSQEAANEAFKRRGEGEGFYEQAVAVADAKRWDRPLDTQGEHRHDFKNPSHQIHVYLQETPVRWAVLTNGRQWRLYNATTSRKLDSYYEINLPAVLESGDLEAFKYFYLFFRHEAFLEDPSGDCFLDDVFDESNIFAQELGEDLQENIYEAIRVLSEGFLQYPENDLAEEHLNAYLPAAYDDFEAERLSLIHDSALIYLYRLIFVLYAESEGRELLDTDNSYYEERFSLNTLKQEVAEELDSADRSYPHWDTELWDDLASLFELIDQGSKSRGIPEDELHIPAYNGGLFRTDPDEDDSREARFLNAFAVGDAHVAPVIDLLARSENGTAGEKIFVDYSSLDIRHLGSIYEGLLEYQLNVADVDLTVEDGEYHEVTVGDNVVVEAGGIYLTTGSGERKATGSYYTPEYIVDYIVENTLEPLVEEIREDLLEGADTSSGGFAEEFAERIFELKILDPAMGSGHFLTSAVDYLAREIIDARERQGDQLGPETIETDHDIYWARRQVVQRCIYGVDLNPLATELAKVSLWLRTLAAEQPLAFLDHHLKTGNSLVGSDIEEVLDNGVGEDDVEKGQLTLHESFDRTRRQALDYVTDQFQTLMAIDNETLADVKEMEAVFDDVSGDPLYQHLLAMANVHTADEFGLDVPPDAYKRMAAALRDDSWAKIEGQDWYTTARAMAEEERFFHWELEFPVAFYGDDGVRDEDAGFDAVIGNPPYVRMEQIKPLKPYLSTNYGVHDSRVDLYAYFVERSVKLSASKYGVIVSNKWMRAKYGENLRQLLTNYQVEQILDFGDLEVFPGISTYPAILIVDITKQFSSNVQVAQFDSLEFESLDKRFQEISISLPADNFGSEKWSMGSVDEERIKQLLDNRSVELSQFVTETLNIRNTVDGLGRGVVTGGNEAFVIDRTTRDDLIAKDGKSREIIKPLLKGTDISRYHIEDESRFLIYAKEGIDIDRYPAVKNHLKNYKDQIGNTATDEEWYELQQDQEEYEPYFEDRKICYPDISKECSFAMDQQGYHLVNTCYFVPTDSYALLGVLNSTPINWYYQFVTSEYRGGYQRSFTHAIKNLPVLPELKDESHPDISEISDLARDITQARREKRGLNLSLLDYISPYQSGPRLSDLEGYQPASGVAETIISETTESRENLQVGSVLLESHGSRILGKLTARYKPNDEDEHETDRWGYTETSYIEAFTLTDLSDTEAALVKTFIPVAVDEGDGFAEFRKNATKNTSLVDRLEAIILPNTVDVENDLWRYLKTKERAEEIDQNIEKKDRCIDEIVFELYGLTDEEIDIVESGVQDE